MENMKYISSICATFSTIDDVLLLGERMHWDEERMNVEHNSITIVNMAGNPRAAGRG